MIWVSLNLNCRYILMLIEHFYERSFNLRLKPPFLVFVNQSIDRLHNILDKFRYAESIVYCLVLSIVSLYMQFWNGFNHRKFYAMNRKVSDDISRFKYPYSPRKDFEGKNLTRVYLLKYSETALSSCKKFLFLKPLYGSAGHWRLSARAPAMLL